MGFGAGFGQGFAVSYNKEMDRQEERKNDSFKLTLSQFLSKSKERQEKEEREQAYVNYAKAMTEGRTDLPDDAYLTIYKMKQAGVPDDQIQSMLNDPLGWKAATGTDIKEAPGTPEVSSDLPPAQTSPSSPITPLPISNDGTTGPIPTRTPSPTPAPATNTPVPTQRPEPTAEERQGPSRTMGMVTPGLDGGQTTPSEASASPSEDINTPHGQRTLLDKLLGRDDQVSRTYNESVDRIAKSMGVDRQTVLDTLSDKDVSMMNEDMLKAAPIYTPSPMTYKVPSLSQANANYTRAQQYLEQHPNDANAKAMFERARIDKESAEQAIKRNAELENGGGYGSPEMTRYVVRDWIMPMQEEKQEMDKRMNSAKVVISGFGSIERIIEQEPAVQAEIVTYFARNVDKIQKNVDEVRQLVDSFTDDDKGRNAGLLGTMKRKEKYWLEQEAAASEEFDRVRDIATAAKLLEVRSQLLAYQIGILYGQKDRSLSEVERKMFQDMVSSTTSIDKFRKVAGALATSEIERINLDAKTISNGQKAKKDLFKRNFDQELKIDPYDNDFDKEMKREGDPRLVEAYKRMKKYGGEDFKTEENVDTSSGKPSGGLPPRTPENAVQYRRGMTVEDFDPSKPYVMNEQGQFKQNPNWPGWKQGKQ